MEIAVAVVAISQQDMEIAVAVIGTGHTSIAIIPGDEEACAPHR